MIKDLQFSFLKQEPHPIYDEEQKKPVSYSKKRGLYDPFDIILMLLTVTLEQLADIIFKYKAQKNNLHLMVL